MKKIFFFPAAMLLCLAQAFAQDLVTATNEPGAFPVLHASLYADTADDAVVRKAASLLQQDMEQVSGKRPGLYLQLPASAQNLVIIGSINRSPLIRQLIRSGKLHVDRIKGKWEAFQVSIIDHPTKNIAHALVIAGSDRRGAAYGVFELSRQMGVSPCYWWADVPVKKSNDLYVPARTSMVQAPSVKYRGIFINDEAPALSGWTKEKFGGFNHRFYEKVFELILRLKGNYIWPAMWGNAFYDDDSLNMQTADDYGIVIGTTHHEPLMRAHDEWRRYGKGKWDYDSNEVRLKQFWKQGLERAGHTEKIVSIGMRGDGDKPMTQGTAIALLERIVKDQRNIIEEVTHEPAAHTPQLWALYKEVQDYYDQGMRVPDDVTLLLCDDNWGNIRRLPRLTDKPRAGGYGIYYHFDYVGGPRNYKWINTNNIARTWEQMHLARAYGVDRIWIVNVGDIKPMEFPISFFLDYAWDPSKWNEDNLRRYYEQWAGEQFGKTYEKEIGEMIRTYSQYIARRKPELLSPDTYSLINYNEAANVTEDFKELQRRAEHIQRLLPSGYRDAFFQLVLHPVMATANLYELYLAVARNRWYASQGLPEANKYADEAKQLFENDSLIAVQYHQLHNGKWNHMMDQTHIGYTYWQQPPYNRMPEVKYIDASAADGAGWPSLPSGEERPVSQHAGKNTFSEVDGYVSLEAAHWTRAISPAGIQWKAIPGIGKSGDGITTFPVTAPVTAPGQRQGKIAPHVEYDFYVYDSGKVTIRALFSPTLNIHNDEGLQYGISIDDEQPQIISINKDDNNTGTWENWVANNIIIKNSGHVLARAGKHVLKFWRVSPAVVLQKLVIDLGGWKPSYLGPPETRMQPGGNMGLKDYYRDYFPVGIAVSPRAMKTDEAPLIVQQFNSVTPENAMKMGPIHPRENEYYWKDADSIVAFAQRHHMKVRGHNLCWHNQIPSWLFTDSAGREVTKAVLLQRLRDHITTVVKRYKGAVYAWDVVNEAISDKPGEYLRNSPWLRICGEEFIADAFRFAHEADPDALLFYNDYNEINPEKREKIIRLVKSLQVAGVPIHGVGLQAHWAINEPSKDQLETTLKEFARLGIKLQITELDVSVYPKEHVARQRRPEDADTSFTSDKEARQRETYRMCFGEFRKYRKQLSGVTFWNISDRHSWLDDFPVRGRKDHPLLFDEQLRPKKSYWDVVNFSKKQSE